MILLSVGTQFPFDRLVAAVDSWASRTGRSDVVAQIGPSTFTPRSLRCFGLISPDEFRSLQREAELFIAHAGMGSILTAIEFAKPIIVMPRDHLRGEHRNGHQVATANRLRGMKGVYVADDEVDLTDKLGRLDALAARGSASASAPEMFTSRLRSFIEEEAPPRRSLRMLSRFVGAAQPHGRAR